jgi:pilus assembly protein CpaC
LLATTSVAAQTATGAKTNGKSNATTTGTKANAANPSGTADKAGEASNTRAAGQVSPVREEERELNLSVGENATISAFDVESYSEGLRDVVRVKLTPDASKFVIVGDKPGTTTLLLIMKDKTQVKYTINVSVRSMQTVQNELMQLLEGSPGIRVRRIGARLFIEGGVSNEAEFKRISQIAALFPGQVESLVVQGGAAAARQVNIRVDFYFVQYDRSRSYQVGVGWPARIGGPGVASANVQYDFVAKGVTSAQASIVNQPLLGLDMAANKGWAKVLKHSTVITSNGSPAQFSSGGEQNYVVSTGLTAALTQIHFGTDVRVLPRYDPITHELEVKVEADVMDLTPPVAAGTNLPGRNVSKLSTIVGLKMGQSIVLSGIRTRNQRHGVSGLPLLSEIPILGVFFGSHSDAQEDTEGAVFVVPSVIESVSKSAQELVNEALSQYQEFHGDMDDVRTWQQTPMNVKPAVPAPEGQSARPAQP